MDIDSESNDTNHCEEDHDYEFVIERHKREKKELQAQIVQLKHSIPKNDKKKKKEINGEISLLEDNMRERHAKELEESKARYIAKDLSNQVKALEIKDDKVEYDFAQEEDGIKYKEVKVSKAQRRRERKNEKEKEKQERIAEEEVNSVDIEKKLEEDRLKVILAQRQLEIHEIPSDGDCMYRAIQHQLSVSGLAEISVIQLRHQCADYMRSHKYDFIPFLTSKSGDDIMSDTEFDQYCNDIEMTSCWGGQIELKALALVLKKPIEVIQARGQCVVIGDERRGSSDRLLISYHRHAYKLGEHYNSLIHQTSHS